MTEVRIVLHAGEGSDDEELASQTSKLRRELLGLDVDDVTLATAGPAPEGARAGDVIELGTLLVALAGAPHLVTSVGQVLSAWVSSRNGRGVAVQLGEDRIELSGITRDDQERMLRVFEQHAGG